MKARTIKAIFDISEDSDIAGVKYTCGKKTITVDDMTEKERIRMLNAWSGHFRLFYNCYFKEKDN